LKKKQSAKQKSTKNKQILNKTSNPQVFKKNANPQKKTSPNTWENCKVGNTALEETCFTKTANSVITYSRPAQPF